MNDYIVRATAADHSIRAFAITSKNIVEEARKDHNTSPVITAALGRLLSGAAMMGTMIATASEALK
jgi:molecular chaperone Hsp33